MLRVTVCYDGFLDEDVNLLLKISEVNRKLTYNRMRLMKEDKSGNGKPKLVFSLTLYGCWTSYLVGSTVFERSCHYRFIRELYFQPNRSMTNIDYELMRLIRGDMPIREMMARFPYYRNYQCNDDEDYHDTNIIMSVYLAKWWCYTRYSSTRCWRTN